MCFLEVSKQAINSSEHSFKDLTYMEFQKKPVLKVQPNSDNHIH